MAENGNQADPVELLDHFAVDGELHRIEEFTAREQRELRRVLRITSGHEEASLAALLNFGLADDCDIYPAAVYIVKLRADPNAQPEQFENMDLAEVVDETRKLVKQKAKGGRRRPQKAATSET